ncbi:MAG: GlxA family transcriptional regulator [Janthinobacterium lividum]
MRSAPTEALPRGQGCLSVGIVPLPNFTLTAFAGFIDMLRLAADEGDRSRPRACAWTVLAPDLRPVRASCGVELTPNEVLGAPERFDYVVVVGGLLPSPDDKMLDPRTLAFLRRAHEAGRNLVGICTGSLALAEAGLLRKGVRCCVSWYHYPDLIERFPDLVPVADQLWVQSGRVATCAGGLAATDLAAALVTAHLGGSVAQKGLHILLSDGPRAAGAAQPQPANTVAVRDPRVRRTMLLMEQSLSTPPSVDALAAAVAISPRQLERLFRKELGASLQSFGRDLRLSYAVWLMAHTPGRLSDVAAQCGFTDAAHFSRSFRRAFALSPVAAQRQGGAALQGMMERWWPYGGLPVAGPATTGSRRQPASADRRPYV